jgi:hypothetical protein
MTEDYWRQTVIERLQDHEQRIRTLEREVRDNTIVVRSARWVAVVVGGSALTMIATIIFEKASA